MRLSRFQAFGGHLLVSAVVGIFSSALVFFVWYPNHLPFATGVTAIFIILLAVDVLIGPCVTLIVFNHSKKELKRDLAIVLLLQISALLYGMHTVFIARPVYYVFNVDRFDLVYANDLMSEKFEVVQNDVFRSTPWLGPKVIGALAPNDSQKRKEIMFSALAGGDDLPQLPQYYVPYIDLQNIAAQRAQPMSALRLLNLDNAEKVDALSKKYTAKNIDLGYLPLRGKINDLSVLLDRKDGSVLEIVDLRPWGK
jgi:hypothetical protein